MKNRNLHKAASVAALAGALAMPETLVDPGSGYKPGQVFFANDSRFLETYFQEALTAYAVGFKDTENIEGTLDFIAPPVPVGRRFEWKKADNAQAFLSEVVDDQRAIGSDFKRVEYTGEDVTDKTLNKGLTIICDLDNVSGPNWERDKTNKLLRRLQRNELRRAFSALSAAATNTNKTWGSSADPDQDVRADLITSANASGVRPNRVLYGDTAFNTRLGSYRAQNNAGADASARLTPAELASALMVDRVAVSRERYQSSASAKSEIVSTKVLMFYAQDGVDTEDASHLKRFWSAVEGGGKFRVYRQQISSKLVAITVEHYSKVVVTFTTGIRQFTVAAS